MALINRNMRQNYLWGCERFRCRRRAQLRVLFPPLINDDAKPAFITNVAAELVGAENVNRERELVMASEDFPFMLDRRPGSFIAVGNGDTSLGHNPSYDVNDPI